MHEMRIYQVNPGKLDEWMEVFHSTVIPVHEAAGVKILAGWRDDAKHQFIWFRDCISEELSAQITQNLRTYPAMQRVKDPEQIGLKVVEARNLTSTMAPRF